MDKLYRLASIVLIFSLSLSSFAYVPLDGSENVSPYIQRTSSGTAASCVQMENIPGAQETCCEGLVKNPNTGKCDEPAIEDTSLVSCSSNNDCSGGTGCFQQTLRVPFSNVSPNRQSVEIISERASLFEMDISDVETIKPVGGICTHARECDSYFCSGGKCTERKVCRYAGEGEVASGRVKCGEGMVKNPLGKCEWAPQVYPGLLTNVTIAPAGKCQFELDADTKEKSVIAMKSLRAMEWFLATISLESNDECFGNIPLLKDDVGKKFHDKRKQILADFSRKFALIEGDFKKLLEAKKDGQENLTIHEDEVISEGQLASRQSSGYDALLMMYRRNILFQTYEEKMLANVKEAGLKLSKLAEAMSEWRDDQSSWNNGERDVPFYRCDARYKRWRPFYWRTKYHSHTKNRWTNYYQVSGDASRNAQIIKRKVISENLALIGNTSPEAAIREFTKQNYYLMDPLMYGGLSFSRYGQEKDLGRTGFLGLGRRDLRKPRYLKGDASGNFGRIRNDLKSKIKDFYKEMKIDSSQRDFVNEPEITMSTSLPIPRDCLHPQLIENSRLSPVEKSKRKQSCSIFNNHLDEVVDQAFAYWLAYSKSNRADYQGYFQNARTWRRKLFAKLEVDVQNISGYYEQLVEHREDQNICIEKVVNGLVDSEILASDNNGLIEGNYNLPGGAAIKDARGASSLNALKLNKLSRAKFSFNLSDASLRDLGNKSFGDNIPGVRNTSSRAGVGDTSNAHMAMRKNEMIKSNEKASALGIKVSDKEKAVREVMSSLAKNASGPAGSVARSASPSSSGSNNISITSDETKKADEAKIGDSSIENPNSVNFNGSNSGLSGMDYIPDKYKSVGSEDPTGLSETDKKRIISEYERNKKDYQVEEEDGIFSIVSKAYVRSLEKILTRKKRLD